VFWVIETSGVHHTPVSWLCHLAWELRGPSLISLHDRE
jgi:hypothetical protein